MKRFNFIEPEILYTRTFRQKFGASLRPGLIQVDMVVPYIGKSPWGDIEQFALMLLRKDCIFNLTTSPPSEHEKSRLSPDTAEKLVHAGVNLNIRSGSTLHSKIYQFTFRASSEERFIARVAFVGSANFSKGGFKNNDETVAFFQGKADNDRVATEIARLSTGNGSQPYIQFLARRR